MQRNGFTEDEALSRINAQMSMREKCSRADYIIKNSGHIDDTFQQVSKINDELSANMSYLKVRIPALLVLGTLILAVSFSVSWITDRLVLK